MVGEVRSNLNDQYIYPVQFARLIWRRRIKDKTGVLRRVFVIGVADSYLDQAFWFLKQIESSGIVFGEARANLNDQYIYPVQFSRLICRRHKRNKTDVLHRVFAIVFAKSFLSSHSAIFTI